jgi:hypothetical protein
MFGKVTFTNQNDDAIIPNLYRWQTTEAARNTDRHTRTALAGTKLYHRTPARPLVPNSSREPSKV